MARSRKTRQSGRNKQDFLRKPHVKKGDTVIVIAGAEKGKTGTVQSVDRKNWRVIVEGLNRRMQTQRPTPTQPQPRMVEKECPIHISNVMLLEKYEARRKGREQTAPDTGSEPAQETEAPAVDAQAAAEDSTPPADADAEDAAGEDQGSTSEDDN